MGSRRGFLAGVAGLAGGCLGQAPASDVSVSLLLNWKPNGLHVPYYQASHRGFYAAEDNIGEVSITAGNGSDFSIKQVTRGQTDLAVTSADQVLTAADRGLDPLVVGVVMQHSPVVLFSNRSKFGEPFTSLEQLAGRRVGVGPGMVETMSLAMLDGAGVREEVSIEQTGYETVQQVLAGDVDAAGGVFGDAIAARFAAADAGEDVTIDVVPARRFIEAYGHVIAVDRSLARERPNVVRAFLRATARGGATATTHPAEGIDALVATNQALETTRARQRATWEQLASGYMVSQAVVEHGWGYNTSEPWEAIEAVLTEADIIDGVRPEEHWTNEYLAFDDPFIGTYTAKAGVTPDG